MFYIDYLLVCVEQHTDRAVWRLGTHALVVLLLFFQVGRSVLPQVSQRFSPALNFQTTLLYLGKLMWILWSTENTITKLTYTIRRGMLRTLNQSRVQQCLAALKFVFTATHLHHSYHPLWEDDGLAAAPVHSLALRFQPPLPSPAGETATVRINIWVEQVSKRP